MSISLETLALAKKYTDEHGGGGTGGTMNYTDLINKPSINGVELVGDKTTAELGIKDGQTPNITTGTVETLPAGSDVTASITGQTPNLVLNLGIPQGQQGDPGEAATIAITETETVAPDSPAAMVELPGSTPQARLYKAQVPQGPRGPAGAGIPPTDTAKKGDVPTWNGENVVWGTPPSGGEEKPWSLFQEITGDGDTAYWEWTGLGFTELFLVGIGLTTILDTSQSKLQVYINGNEIGFLDTQKLSDSSSTRYQRFYAKYNGLFWDAYRLPSVNGESAGYGLYASIYATESIKLNVGKCETLKIRTPGLYYILSSGTLKIYVR